MWVADMEFRPPACVQAAVEKMAAHGVYGYFGNDGPYLEAIQWWMQTGMAGLWRGTRSLQRMAW